MRTLISYLWSLKLKKCKSFYIIMQEKVLNRGAALCRHPESLFSGYGNSQFELVPFANGETATVSQSIMRAYFNFVTSDAPSSMV